MWKKEAKENLTVFIKAGLPFTIAGMAIVFFGIYFLKHLLAGSEYLPVILFAWLAVFWIIYQPLFKNRIAQIKTDIKNKTLSPDN